MNWYPLTGKDSQKLIIGTVLLPFYGILKRVRHNSRYSFLLSLLSPHIRSLVAFLPDPSS
jgi:hypothetical protein